MPGGTAVSEQRIAWFSDVRTLYHADRLVHLSRGEVVFPAMVEIDLLDQCNHDCVWCIDREVRKKDQTLSLSVLRKLMEELAECGVESVVLKGGGEPTMHPDFVQVVEALAAHGLRIGLITNGRLLKGDVLEAVIRHCEWVRISLDGGSTAVHARVHRSLGGWDFDDIIADAKALKERAPAMTVGFNYCYHPLNAEDIERVVEVAVGVGVDYVAFRPVIYRSVEEGRSIIPPAEREANIERRLQRAQAMATERTRVLIKDRTPPVQAGLSCLSHHLIGIILSDGTCLPCCFAKERPDLVLGNVRYQSFREVWTGPRRTEVNALIEAGTCRRLCGGCNTDRAVRYWKYNGLIHHLQLQEHKEFV